MTGEQTTERRSTVAVWWRGIPGRARWVGAQLAEGARVLRYVARCFGEVCLGLPEAKPSELPAWYAEGGVPELRLGDDAKARSAGAKTAKAFKPALERRANAVHSGADAAAGAGGAA